MVTIPAILELYSSPERASSKAALQRTVRLSVHAWVYGEELHVSIRRLDAVILGLPLVLALPRIKRCL